MSQPYLTSPLRLLQRILPIAMLVVFLAGLGGGIRLALYLGQPFAGFVMSWRKELSLFTVSYVTPAHWSGMVAGLQSNDRILCIAGYTPKPEAVLYGLDPRYAGIDCPNGGKAFPLGYRELVRQGQDRIDLLVDRDGSIILSLIHI